MTNREQLENEVAALICEHAGIGYEFKNGHIDADSLFLTAHGAAHVVVHHILSKLDRR